MIPAPVRATAAGLCAILVGIGIARFAYTPLLPALIEAGWFAPSAAAYLGAANLMGYLAGALAARAVARRTSAVTVLRASMAVCALSCLACAVPVSFAWYFAWRALAGFAGGGLVALAAPTVLPLIDPARRGLASGVIFTSVGIGIVGAGTLVPLLLEGGPALAWLALGGVGSLLTLLSWRAWPSADATVPPPPPPRATPVDMRPLYVAYALDAFGLVPHMVFLVDFIARGLGRGMEAGAEYWILYGVGALFGPILAGHVGDRIGFGLALRLAFLIQAALVGMLALTDAPALLVLSSLVMGAFTPGIVPLVLGRTQELLPGDRVAQGAAWSVATTAFAIGQAAGAYGLSYVYALGGDHRPLFALGAVAFGLAMAIDLAAGRRRAR
ncbi:putative MFS family arabinose efflux permease [Stella humosa]|uniref:Putative MFS family arabinose efflux permease n=1 Tax=Stella humosa TaxID=94 RepID=A0A3N1M7F7_9PROT|nr:YbfB/YjiJ family MFS transporter [Stella humosa]ROP99652.1 putative MFS family arabinose efflux permease [Stella humosa]BBK31123.1 MFS transporter [Stella humosa]